MSTSSSMSEAINSGISGHQCMFARALESWEVEKGEWSPCDWHRKEYGWRRIQRKLFEKALEKGSSWIYSGGENELMLFLTQRSFVLSPSVSTSFPGSLVFRDEWDLTNLFPALFWASDSIGRQHWPCWLQLQHWFEKHTCTSPRSGRYECVQVLE